MSKKFFSFIHGDGVHIAPNQKVIPAEEFSTLQSALEVLEKAKQDAELYKKEVVAEIEVLKEQAQREGYEAGFTQWVAHVEKLEAEIGKVRQDMEKMVLPVALKAAQKMVSKELELAPSTISNIVSANLKAVAQHKQVTIYVNKKDLEILEAQRTQLKQIFEQLEVLSIRERADIAPGGCVIETEGGIINAQIENRWRILETAFQSRPKK
ncbi:MAG: HrpE/YscL family type III secretion apparatus protein [Parachlamydiaceae bacterium]|nr:HrpE/YscL family type III secretion apparatus protein [Parachlamydiaceae bacterium]